MRILVAFLLVAACAGAQDGAPVLRAVVDADKTYEPISEYVYGQSLEHVGRCIYDGIWAERLQDRKFFYDLHSNESPWRLLLGPQEDPNNIVVGGQARMARDHAYAGEHSVCVEMSGEAGPIGIIQHHIPLSRGEYVGRIIFAAHESAGPLEVEVVWGPGQSNRQAVRIHKLDGSWRSATFRVAVRNDTQNGSFAVKGYGRGELRVGAVSLMPADNIHGMRRDVIELLRELDAAVYRWPGGNFVSGYNWRDGIGDRDRRPPRKNPAWKGVEQNDFGIDEFITFCRMLGAQPYVVVDTAGNAEDAAALVEYANGGLDTPMGRLRAQNKRPEPYNVTWWGVGNGMCGDGQPLEDYAGKHNEFAQAMLAADPSIKLVGVGATGERSRGMLAECADYMDLLSEHFYCDKKEDLAEHIAQISNAVRGKAAERRQYAAETPALAEKDMPIALDEWNYWYGDERHGELGVRYHLKDGLGIAAGLHEMFRNSDVFFMANYARAINALGAIKTTPHAAWFEPTGLVLAMYRRHYGTVPVAVSGAPDALDVTAAWRDDRKALTVGVVNPAREPRLLELDVRGARMAGGGRAWFVAGSDPAVYNQPGRPPRVEIQQTELRNFAGRIQVPALSANIFELDVEQAP